MAEHVKSMDMYDDVLAFFLFAPLHSKIIQCSSSNDTYLYRLIRFISALGKTTYFYRLLYCIKVSKVIFYICLINFTIYINIILNRQIIWSNYK